MLSRYGTKGKGVEARGSRSPSSQERNECYKPFVLKWPFIVTLIFILTHILTLVIYVQQLNPYSSNSSWEEVRFQRPRARISATKESSRPTPTSESQDGFASSQVQNISNTAQIQIERREDKTVTVWQPTTITVTVPTTVTTTYTTQYSYPVTLIGETTRFLSTTETVTSSYISFMTYTETWITTAIKTATQTFYDTLAKSPTVASKPETTIIAIVGVSPETKITVIMSPVSTVFERTDPVGSVTKITTILPPVVSTSIIPSSTTTMLFKTILGSHIGGPSSFVIHTTIPGSFVTRTRSPTPFTYITQVDGAEVTTVSTPPAETYVIREEAIVSALTTVVIIPAPTSDPRMEGSGITTIVEPQAPTSYTTNISGSPTTVLTTPPPRTRLSTIPIGWSPKTITQSIGDSSGPSSRNETTVIVDSALYNLTPTEHFTGAFLPTFITTLVGIPISLIDNDARLMHPFHALTRRGGAIASESLDQTFSGPINSFLRPHRLLLQRQPITYLTPLLTWSSWLLVPLSGEAIGLQVYGRFSIQGCAVSLGISPSPKNALVALLATMAFLLILLLHYLRDWNTGVFSYPWSIGRIGALTGDARLRQAIADRLNERSRPESADNSGSARFKLGHSDDGHYGIIVVEDEAQEHDESSRESKTKIVNQPASTSPSRVERTHRLALRLGISKHPARTPFICLTYAWRVVFIAIHMGALALVTYYRIAQNSRTTDILGFKPGFGSRFLFSALGKIISLFWSDFLISKSTLFIPQ